MQHLIQVVRAGRGLVDPSYALFLDGLHDHVDCGGLAPAGPKVQYLDLLSLMRGLGGVPGRGEP